MAKVVFTDAARRSLTEVLTYIAQDNPQAALDLIDDLQTRIVGTLSLFPDAGAILAGPRRVMTVRRYAVVYRYDRARDEAVVLDVFGPGMDWR